MATIDRPEQATQPDSGWFDEEGFPWLENGERMDQKTFHERYSRMPEDVKAELIGGIVYIAASTLKNRHGRSDSMFSGLLFLYSAATPGTEGQNNATTILGEESEPQPDSALLILDIHGGQSIDGEDEYTHGAPELIVEVALTSRSIDLNAKLRDYERAGAREYVVYELKRRTIHWFALREGRFEPLARDPDGVFRSRVFPGLWIDEAAFVGRDKPAVIATLQRGLASPEHAAFVAELERRRQELARKA